MFPGGRGGALRKETHVDGARAVDVEGVEGVKRAPASSLRRGSGPRANLGRHGGRFFAPNFTREIQFTRGRLPFIIYRWGWKYRKLLLPFSIVLKSTVKIFVPINGVSFTVFSFLLFFRFLA